MDLKEKSGFESSKACDEKNHWWIKTRFNYIDLAFRPLKLKNKCSLRVVEFGHGTGQNLWYIKHLSPFSSYVKSLIGIDPLLPNKDCGENGDFYQTNIFDAAIKNSTDLVLAMDVLEHIEDERDAIKSWKKTLHKDGVMLITVPALMSLWSYHDEFLEHKRRYTKDQLIALGKECGLEVVSVRYAFGLLFLPVLFVRKIVNRKYETEKGQKNVEQDLKPPNIIINKVLYWVSMLEAKFGGNPWIGTSVVGIFKIKNEELKNEELKNEELKNG